MRRGSPEDEAMQLVQSKAGVDIGIIKGIADNAVGFLSIMLVKNWIKRVQSMGVSLVDDKSTMTLKLKMESEDAAMDLVDQQQMIIETIGAGEFVYTLDGLSLAMSLTFPNK